MSFIAQRPVRPADSDVTDVDDGGAQITVSTFWPTVKLHDLRLAARIAGDITTSRLMHMATEAVLHVADQLKDWRRQREAEGAESLASVVLTSAGDPVELINGESAKVYRFRRAVYSFTRASVLEGYRDVSTTPKGDKDAEALDRQIDDLWRDGRWSIADIREEARIYAELF
ncbi:head completion/stabilization protein [Raoultella ornithinolytica]|uniref:head completion/stabilization protein n=1 Tax=Raoultella ornithinolytica TaxID=54291 RepID=UPI00224EC9F6|nr:head completion/stabilization protein [Raoultella ornithinolytica]MCX3408497.1 head completion/stabilization protein [Raoultella ornithinolytica]